MKDWTDTPEHREEVKEKILDLIIDEYKVAYESQNLSTIFVEKLLEEVIRNLKINSYYKKSIK